MPRRVAPPEPPLSDDLIRLEPLTRALAEEMRWVAAGDDPDIARFTFLPTRPKPRFVEEWLGRYEDGWEDGARAGFAAREGTGAAVAFAAFVRLDLEREEGEIGYMVAPAARGRGVASRALALLTDWGLAELRLRRIELRIDPRNAASCRVAERCGYAQEGILRSVAFKEGLRTDVGVWSRLGPDRFRTLEP